MDEPNDEGGDAAAGFRRNLNWAVPIIVLALIWLPRFLPFDGGENINVFRRLSEWTIDKVKELFDDYGYWVVFLGVLAENTLLLGLLVPGAIIIILGGLAAENGEMNIWLMFGIAIVATILGDTISYLIGRFGWTRVLAKGSMGRTMENLRERMDAHTTWLILAYHFAGQSRVVGPTAAGLFKVPYRRWAPLDHLGGAAWVVAFGVLGYCLGLAGVELDDTERMVQLFELAITAIIIVSIVLIIRRMRTASDAAEGGAPSTAA